jgi:foldase protein PrsA
MNEHGHVYDGARGWPRPNRFALLAAAALLCAAAVTGCGEDDDSLPDHAVAEVGDAVITKADFERAMRRSMGPANPPWDHARCVAAKQGTAGGNVAGGKAPTRARLDRQCDAEYDRLRTRTLETLIKNEWTRQEAQARDIVVTAADIERALDEARESNFLSAEALRKAGLTVEDLLPNVRLGQLKKKLTDDLTAGMSEVSAEDVADYYRENKAKLMVEERRDVRLILTKTRARADAARAALDEGQGWATVAKKYSLHEASRDKAGKVTDIRKGVVDTPLVLGVFRSTKGELRGPVKADESSWAVFLVERINPSFQATLEQARDEIRDLLASQRRQEALAAFTERYRDMTTCAPGFRISACKNGPTETEGQSGA